jgi:hypothetical protein
MDREIPLEPGKGRRRDEDDPERRRVIRNQNIVLYGGLVLISVLVFLVNQLFLRDYFPFRGPGGGI